MMNSQEKDLYLEDLGIDLKAWLEAFQQLKGWFERYHREFPWRDQPTPYQVWVSEIMLQQTRAEVVVPYFIKWMERFPTIRSLAESSEEEVMKLWEGLGYYRRARFLIQGARKVMEVFAGQLPQDPKLLATIPGLGNYTVQAIIAFAFKEHAAPVDGNVLRVMSRLLSMQQSIDLERTRTYIRNFMLRIMPPEDSPLLAEAFIELGACVCKPIPLCEQCPLKGICRAAANQQQHKYPHRNPRKKIETRMRWVAVILYKDSVYVEYRQEGEIMQGLYEFPYEELLSIEELDEKEQLIHKMALKIGTPLKFIEDLPVQHHHFTHYKMTLFPTLLEAETMTLHRWHPVTLLDQIPFSSGHRKVKKSICYIVDEM